MGGYWAIFCVTLIPRSRSYNVFSCKCISLTSLGPVIIILEIFSYAKIKNVNSDGICLIG